MKIAITADLHLADNGKHPERLEVWRWMMESALQNGAQAIIGAGDMFDRRGAARGPFEEVCKEHDALQVHLVCGNHDPDLGSGSLVAPNVHVYDEPRIETVGGLNFLFVPYVPQKTMAEMATNLALTLQNDKWVLVGHGDYIDGVQRLNGYEPGTYMPLTRNDIEFLTPHRVFLGHIHKSDQSGLVSYAGSPCPLDVSETGMRHYLLFDTQSSELTEVPIETGPLFKSEHFVVYPSDSAIEELKAEIARRIEAWKIEAKDTTRLEVRVSAAGYCRRRTDVANALREGFAQYSLYAGDINVADIRESEDLRLQQIANQVRQKIEAIAPRDNPDGPSQDDIIEAALALIYG